MMTFPKHFWNLQNLEFLVPGAPIFQILRSEALVRQGRKSEIFECVGIDPNRSKSVYFAHFEHIPLLSGAKCGVCAQWGQNSPLREDTFWTRSSEILKTQSVILYTQICLGHM